MKPQSLLALSLTLGLTYGQTPKQHYNRVCPSTDEVEVDSKFFVMYNCGKYAPPTTGYVAHAANSPEECIRACADNNCPGSAWTARKGSKNPCLLPVKDSLPGLVSLKDTVFMTYRKGSGDPFGGEDDEDDCSEVEEKLSKCEEDLTTEKGKVSAKDGELTTCKGDLSTCKSQGGGSPAVSPFKKCPSGQGETITVGDKKYKQMCDTARSLDQSRQKDLWRLTLEECAQAAAALDYKTFMFEGGSRKCMLYKANIENELGYWGGVMSAVRI